MSQPARGAPRHKSRPIEKSSSSGGLFYNVFSFVSREIESFVVNATGGQSNVAPASTSDSARRVRRRRRERGVRETNLSEDEGRRKLSRQRSCERRAHGKGETTKRKSRSKSTDTLKRHHRRHMPPAHGEDADEELSASDCSRSCSPAPSKPEKPSSQTQTPTPLPPLKKKPSITMPGSLFPRSSSLEPDARNNGHPYRKMNAPGSSRTAGPTDGANDLPDPHTSQPHVNSVDTTAGIPESGSSSLDTYISPWRTRPVASVHDAVQRFNVTDGEEADFSLRLHSLHSSPVHPFAKPSTDLESSLTLPSDSNQVLSSSKGKERMQDDDLMYIIGETSDNTHLRTKERELVAAREECDRRVNPSNEGPDNNTTDERGRDKERIKALEEEVKRLREELARSQRRSPAPPPPPPPPPPLPAPLPIRIDTSVCSSDPNSLFASARAALRHTSPPAEAPINASVSGRVVTKKQRQPTVNVPTEKMAAFLNELKTVRLRKVGSGVGTGTGVSAAEETPISSNLSKSTSALTWSSGPIRPAAQELARRRSLVNLQATSSSSMKETLIRAGQKRKADAMGIDELTQPAKRRSMQPCDGTSSTGSRDSRSASASKAALGLLDTSKRTWPAVSTNEADVTTPSLCSDNGDGSIEEQAPLTPPGARSNFEGQRSDVRELEIINVDMEPDDVIPNKRSRTFSSGASARIPKSLDVFDKRPPMSPIPNPTPRKPTAPARARRVSTPKPKYIPPASDSDSDAHDRETAPAPFLSLVPVSPQKKSALSGKGRPPRLRNAPPPRRKSKDGPGPPTLDEELRAARDSGNEDLDDNVFVGTGTRSKRTGFLAHGGAGGSPVFMGVGYVRDTDADLETRKKDVRRRAPKSASLIPRLGGNS